MMNVSGGRLQCCAAVVAFALLTAYGRGTPIVNIQSAAIPPNPAATMENIGKAIIRAGQTLGWHYDGQDNTIHSNYNGWIRNLEKAMRAQVSVL